MNDRYMSRAGRKLQVYKTMYETGRSYTMYEIAKMVGLKPSTHLLKMLMEMCEESDLEYYEAQHRPNSVKRLFYVRALSQGLSQMSLPL